MSETGSIPAWAGEPNGVAVKARTITVYPRVGGGTGKTAMGITGCPGLSPRGRGNRGLRIYPVRRQRSIPAWAGEPIASFVGDLDFRVYPRVGGGTAAFAGV